jgi:hypothetical protein
MRSREIMKTCGFAILIALGLVGITGAYPNGTPNYVTDLVPACASCHSVLDPATMPELPSEVAAQELASNKHIGAIRSGAFPIYGELTDKEKDDLAKEVEALDREARVELISSTMVSPGKETEVQVNYTGGNGPVVGIMLVDRRLRYQARPIQATGWMILDVRAKTSMGRDASMWFARRIDRGKANLNFLLIPAERPAGGPPPSGNVTFKLVAPQNPGHYSITAVFLYGTENTDRAGFFHRPSGRILFSKDVVIVVEETAM